MHHTISLIGFLAISIASVWLVSLSTSHTVAQERERKDAQNILARLNSEGDIHKNCTAEEDVMMAEIERKLNAHEPVTFADNFWLTGLEEKYFG